MNKKIVTYDVYNKEYIVDPDKLNLSVHLYGIAIKNNKILIVPQFDGFDFPGGTAEKGETHLETLVREIREETGYSAEPIEIINAYTSYFHHKKRNIDYQSYIIYYFVNITGGEISTQGFDEYEKEYAKKAKWVDLDYLKSNKHACSIDIKNELINAISKKINTLNNKN